MKRTARALVMETMARVTTYTAQQARALHGQPGVQLVDMGDVRELEREGVIPEAFHVPRGMLEFWADPQSPEPRPEVGDDTEYVLFGDSGWHSVHATQTLTDFGVAHGAGKGRRAPRSG